MFLDTTIILEILRRDPDDPWQRRFREQYGAEPLLCSPIQLGEVADYHRKHRLVPDESVARARGFLETIPVDEETALLASALKAEARSHRVGKDFSLIDGVVLAAARRRSQKLLTLAKE